MMSMRIDRALCAFGIGCGVFGCNPPPPIDPAEIKEIKVAVAGVKGDVKEVKSEVTALKEAVKNLPRDCPPTAAEHDEDAPPVISCAAHPDTDCTLAANIPVCGDPDKSYCHQFTNPRECVYGLKNKVGCPCVENDIRGGCTYGADAKKGVRRCKRIDANTTMWTAACQAPP